MTGNGKDMEIFNGWPQIYDGGHNDTAWGIAIDSYGNVIVTGLSYDGSTYNFHTIKYDSNGKEIWNATYDSGIEDQATDVAIDSEDSIIVVGFKGIMEDTLPEGCYHVIKYDSNGKEIWNVSYKIGKLSFPIGVAVDAKDNIIVTGVRLKYGFGGIELPCWTIKLDKNGEQIWNETFQIGAQDEGHGVAIDSKGDIIIAGYTSGYSSFSCFIVKYDGNGNETWAIKYGKYCMASDVAIDSKGNIVIVGSNFSKGYYKSDYYIAKLNEHGNILWTKSFDSGGNDLAYAVAIDSYDNIIVGGVADDKPCIVMYDEDREQKMIKMPEIKGGIMDIAFANGAIYTAGWIERENLDYYIAKYVDTTPPLISIEKPKENCLYIANREIMAVGHTIIIGKINIETIAEDESGIKKIEFYIDNDLKAIDYEMPYEWLWNEIAMGKHEIKVIAYDSTDTIAMKKMEVMIFNI